jgi:hypothetical protein
MSPLEFGLPGMMRGATPPIEPSAVGAGIKDADTGRLFIIVESEFASGFSVSTYRLLALRLNVPALRTTGEGPSFMD